jgi:hypothetical protein
MDVEEKIGMVAEGGPTSNSSFLSCCVLSGRRRFREWDTGLTYETESSCSATFLDLGTRAKVRSPRQRWVSLISLITCIMLEQYIPGNDDGQAVRKVTPLPQNSHEASLCPGAKCMLIIVLVIVVR